MGRGNRKKKRSSSASTLERTRGAGPETVPLRPANASRSSGRSPAAAGAYAKRIEAVHQAIERQSYKSALDKAKQLHKQMASPESQALLIEAYLARIRGMMAKNMLIEAKALAELMIQRFPQAADQVIDLQCTLAAKSSDIDALVAPLAGLTSPKQWPQAIQDAIRRDVTDPGALAECRALAADHPLRVAARAVARAFAAVTSGPVTDADLALPEVSRKSPLAPWKTLIRALACMYRGRDQACLKNLDTLDPDSAAAELAPVVRSILADAWDPRLDANARQLVESVAGDTVSLRSALRCLDEDLQQSRPALLQQHLRRAFTLCAQVRPDLSRRLRQHLYVKSLSSDLPQQRRNALLEKPPYPDAYFWRLMAKDAESDDEIPYACAMWDQFRLNAVREGLFSADGPENVFLYLHMVDLLRTLDARDLEEAQWEYSDDPPDFDFLYELADFEVEPPDKPKDALYFIHPERLYERACAVRPDADVFKRWLDYAAGAELSQSDPDEVAERWACACPDDWRPWLCLAESAEGRNAFTKALKYVDRVEQLGGHDPKAQRARARLLAAKALRHLKQGKRHLVSKDITELQALSSAAEPDQRAFVGTLEWTQVLLGDDPDRGESLKHKVSDLLGGEVAAALLLLSVTSACKCSSRDLTALRKWLSAYKQKDLVQAMARVCPMGRDMNLVIQIPAIWRDRLCKWFRKSACGLPMDQLRIVTEAVLTAGWNETAYHCTRHGLQAERVHRARFLFLRAQCLPVFSLERRQDCLDAAVHLARATRQMELVTEIVDYRRDDPGSRFRNPFGLSDGWDLDLTEEQVHDIMGTELQERKYPSYVSRGLGRYGPAGECQCPKCRRRRRQAQRDASASKPGPKPKQRQPDPQMLLFDDLYDEEDAPEATDVFTEDDVTEVNDLDLDDAAALAGLPKDVLALLSEISALNNGKPFTDEGLDRVLDANPGLRERLYGTLMENMMNGGLTPDILGVDVPGPLPFGPRPQSRKRKKRKR